MDSLQDNICYSTEEGQIIDDCGAGLCCGIATSFDEEGFELGKLHVCSDASSAEWMDHLDWETLYSFECMAGSGAIKLGASLAVVATALYMSA